MRFRNFVLHLIVCGGVIAASSARAQSAQPTANKMLELSGFGGINGTYTRLNGGRNLGITAGLDLGIRSFHGFRPFLEGRGTYPVHGGHIAAERNALGGLRVEKPVLPGLRVYGDFLLGRGQIDYQNGGYPIYGGTYLLLTSTSNVYSPGGGAEYRFTERFSGLADVQFQHYATPATSSGSLWSVPILFGVRYHLNFNRHGYPAAP